MCNDLYDEYEKHCIRIQEKYNRNLPFQDALFDRWERAKKLGFGEGSNIYNSAFVYGDVLIGKNVWIGPNVILDGSAAQLIIGDGCTISAGVHIYTHDNVMKTLTGGVSNLEIGSVKIGTKTYIGSQSIVNKGVEIGDMSVIGANSFVNTNIKSKEVFAGTPAKQIGYVSEQNGNINLVYTKCSK